MNPIFSTSKFLLIGVVVMVAFYGGQLTAPKGDNTAGAPGQPVMTASAEASPEAAPANGVVLKTLSSTGFETLLAEKKQPTLLFLYASWCPYCRQQFAAIDQLRTEYADKVNIVTASVDQDAGALKQSLDAKPQPLNFIPYHVTPAEMGQFRGWLSKKGAPFRGAIPFSVLFNENGEMKAQFPGLVQAQDFKSAIDNLSK